MTLTSPAPTDRRSLVVLISIAAAAGLLGVITAGLITMVQPTTYGATLTLVANGASSTDGSETLGRTIVALVQSDAIADDLASAVPSDLSPAEIQSNLEAERPPGSSVVNITYSDTDEARATQTISALPDIFQARLKALDKSEADAPANAKTSSGAPDVSIWDDGQGTVKASSPPVLRNAAIGGVLAASLAIVVAVLWPRARRSE